MATAAPMRMRRWSFLAVFTRRPTRGAPARTKHLCRGLALAGLVLSAPASAPTAYNFYYGFGSAQIHAPDALAIDPSDGEVFVADGGRIAVFSPSGTPNRAFGQASGAIGVSPVPPYDVYAYDPRAGLIERYSNQGTPLGGFNVAGARGLTFDPQGNVYVADTHGITRFAPDGSSPTTITATVFGSLGATASGLLAADSATDVVRQVGFDGTLGRSFGSGSLDAPHAIAADGEGDVLVTDSGHRRVAIFGPGGALVASFGSRGGGEGQFQMPSGIAWSPVNRLIYVADTV